jgi:hypothetical protein
VENNESQYMGQGKSAQFLKAVDVIVTHNGMVLQEIAGLHGSGTWYRQITKTATFSIDRWLLLFS